jgi:hypothetical protein
MKKLIDELTMIFGLLFLIIKVMIPFLVILAIILIGFFYFLKLEFYLIDTFLR